MTKITERRIVTQSWYESDSKKTGWTSYGWQFDDENFMLFVDGNWNVVEHIRYDKFGNPIIGIAEQEVEI
jgi:hypothetical protein